MVEFKVVVSDKEKSYQLEVSGSNANSLIGKKIGDELDGIFVNLPGYKLAITGGCDKDGFPMRRDFIGARRERLLLTEGIGFRSTKKGLRKKKSIRGNTISSEIVQINMKVIKRGPREIKEMLAKK